jgi:hypothetical protein
MGETKQVAFKGNELIIYAQRGAYADYPTPSKMHDSWQDPYA